MGLFCDCLLISRRSREEPRRLNDYRRRWPPPRVYRRRSKETRRRGFVIGPDTCREGRCGATPGSVRDTFDGRSVSSSASIPVKVRQCPLANLISLYVCRSICCKRGRLDGAAVRWRGRRRQKRCSLFYTAIMQLGRRPRCSECRFGRSNDVSFHEGGCQGVLNGCRFAFISGPTRVVDPAALGIPIVPARFLRLPSRVGMS